MPGWLSTYRNLLALRRLFHLLHQLNYWWRRRCTAFFGFH